MDPRLELYWIPSGAGDGVGAGGVRFSGGIYERVGSLVVHGSHHVAANVNTYRSVIYLPPDLDGYAERGSGAAGLAIAAAWVLVAGSLIDLERRRLFPARQE